MIKSVPLKSSRRVSQSRRKKPALAGQRLKDATTEAARRHCADSLLAFAKFCDPMYQPARLHEYLAGLLQAVESGAKRRIIISVPVRHGKSRLVAVEFPAWLLGRNPGRKIITASYGSDLSEKHSREAMDRVMSDRYRWVFPRTHIAPGKRSVREWGTAEGGTYKATGVGGALSGHGADVLLLDDLVKDFQDAHSETIREGTWNWFLSTAMTRLSATGSVILIGTRWHTDDIIGRLTDPARLGQLKEAGVNQQWEVVNFPGIAKENDPFGRAPGEALWPERWSAEMIREQMVVQGSYIASAMYDGVPVASGGNYIKVANFQFCSAAQVPTDTRRVRFWDLATTSDTMADFSAGVKATMDKAGNLYVMDVAFGQWDWPKTRGMINMLGASEKILVGIEAVAGFKTSLANVRETISKDVVVQEFGADKDKLTRALPWIALSEAKKVFLVTGDWNAAFVNQCREFPNGKNDDMIDGVSGSYIMLTQGRVILVS